MANSSQRKEYSDLLKNIRAIVNENDPIGLIANGAPSDEYDMEVSRIAIALRDSESSRDFAKSVNDIFVKFFGEEYNGDYATMSAQLWELRRV